MRSLGHRVSALSFGKSGATAMQNIAAMPAAHLQQEPQQPPRDRSPPASLRPSHARRPASLLAAPERKAIPGSGSL